MPINRTRLLDRSQQQRDARVFVIATEGARTEPSYFAALQARGLIDTIRVRLEVLPAVENKSAPNWVLERLDSFCGKHDVHEDLDQLWLVIDLDQWGAKKLSDVAKQCREKGYFLAVSRPCFEVWNILHREDLSEELADNAACEARLRQLLGSYNYANPDWSHLTLESSWLAVRRAEALDAPRARWPQKTGSRLHRLMSLVLRKATA